MKAPSQPSAPGAPDLFGHVQLRLFSSRSAVEGVFPACEHSGLRMTEVAEPAICADASSLRTTEVSWMPYRLFPYERALGLRELSALDMAVVDGDEECLTVAGNPAYAAMRCTYFDRFVDQSADEVVQAEQSAVERRHFNGRQQTATRQATRYGLHGIHEYKGKFNPQVVRALCNVVDPTAELLIDPFCGSGTGPLEGLRLGLDVLAIDQSPMAWYLTRAKLGAATSTDKAHLGSQFEELAKSIAETLSDGQTTGKDGELEAVIGVESTSYLRSWFTAPAFSGLSQAAVRLHRADPSIAVQLAFVALSSILRTVSLQLPEDLRVRRRPEPFEAPQLAPLFLSAADGIRNGLAQMDHWTTMGGSAEVVLGSTEAFGSFSSAHGDRRRLIVTSPPYATALPYIDTDRLSITALGLGTPSDQKLLERELIGSREWLRAQQTEWDDRRARNSDLLPIGVVSLLSHIADQNKQGDAGFRRQALPSLLYRYFAGMAAGMATWARVLRPGERAVLIVGHNRTTANGEEIDIPTPELLAEMSTDLGFRVVETIQLETWPRYGLHHANGVPGEDALVLERSRK
jgi:hypothetical protein